MRINNNRGFSLIEVLVTVGLIGVLVGIAVPSYNKYKQNTSIVALKADMGNAHKSYVAYDAIENTYCASWTSVGLASSSTENVYKGSQIYRKKAFIGFSDTLNTDCTLSTPVLNHKTTAPTATTLMTETDCKSWGGTWDSMTSMCSAVSTTNNYGTAPADCKLGSDTFKLGATTSVANINTFYFINDAGIFADNGSTNNCP